MSASYRYRWRYLNDSCQGWQRKPWFKLSDVCPYHNDHRETKVNQLDFARAAWFRFYCSGRKGLGLRRGYKNEERGGSTYRHGKLYKLYWRLHGDV